ncbi:MAG: DEAD/DEAH box helicase, partial [Bacteroidota bacterium]
RQKLIWKSIGSHRKELRKLLKALKVRRNVQQEALFAQTDFDIILKIFPIWLVNLADVSELVPLKTALFDLAIIDEASQCDVASSLPILQRAKKVLIVGDDQQLRHISFLSRKRQEQLQVDNGLLSLEYSWLDYRDTSILDMINEQIPRQEQVSFLDEHYRSLPEIIQFSNHHFYRDALHIMQQRPGLSQTQGVQLILIEEGRRSAKGYNDKEAQAILDCIIGIIREEASQNAHTGSSIGVLSPFRDQVDYLSQLLRENIPLGQLEKHQVLLGTAHSFQGNERDIMLISLVLDEQASGGSFRFLNQPDVFNVSITRARSRQYVFCSLPPRAWPSDSLLGKYLAYIEDPFPRHPNHSEENHSIPYEFADEVKVKLEENGWEVRLSYPVAGLNIDLLVSSKDKFLGLDLIAYEGIFGHMISLERYKMLHRTGLRIFPLSYTRWKQEADFCLQEIEKALLS